MLTQEHMVCQVRLGIILIQNRNFRDLSGLVDSLGTKMILRVKFRDINGNYVLKNNRAFVKIKRMQI